MQLTVNSTLASGLPGEVVVDGPHRALTYELESADELDNIFGRAFTVSQEGIAQVGNPDGNGVFAGFLIGPKQTTFYGPIASYDGSPVNNYYLPNGSIGELLTMGTLLGAVTPSAPIGNLVIFDNITGELDTIPPNTPVPFGWTAAPANVIFYTGGAPGSSLAMIQVLDSVNVSELDRLGTIFGFGPDVGPPINGNENFENGNFYT